MGGTQSQLKIKKSNLLSKKNATSMQTQSIETTKKLNNNNNNNKLSLSTKISASSSICSENLLKVESNKSSRVRSSSAANVLNENSIIPLKDKQLIISCFNNSHENIGKRIIKRAAEKRNDFAQFYFNATVEQRNDIEECLKVFLNKSVSNIDNINKMRKLGQEFGKHLVQYRAIGFKTDFFTTICDSIITECILLDNAIHQTHQTLNAFSLIITILFSSVRDGFYDELKYLRRTSYSLSIKSNVSNNEIKKLSSSKESSLQSINSGADSPKSFNIIENNNKLLKKIILNKSNKSLK